MRNEVELSSCFGKGDIESASYLTNSGWTKTFDNLISTHMPGSYHLDAPPISQAAQHAHVSALPRF